jgi:hypothetical protein
MAPSRLNELQPSPLGWAKETRPSGPPDHEGWAAVASPLG